MFKPKKLKTIIEERILTEHEKHHSTTLPHDWVKYSSSKIISTMKDRIKELKIDLNEKKHPYVDLVFNYLLNGESTIKR